MINTNDTHHYVISTYIDIDEVKKDYYKLKNHLDKMKKEQDKPSLLERWWNVNRKLFSKVIDCEKDIVDK